MGQKHFMLSLYRLGRQIPVQGDLSGQLRTILPLHGTAAPLQQSQMAIAVRRNSHHQSIPAADPSPFNQQFHDKQELPDYNNPMLLRSVGSDSPLIPVLRQAARSI